MQEHRVVAREVAAVVGEHHDAVARDLGVGGVEVDRRPPRPPRAPRRRARGRGRAARRGDPVGRREPGPAVAPPEELVREAEANSGHAREVRELARCRARAQRQRARRSRSCRRSRGAPRPRSPRGARRASSSAGVELLLHAEDLARDGAGVLGIDVDRAVLERGHEDRGVAEAGLVLGGGAGGARGLGRDLAQDVGLGEALRADAKGVLVGPCGDGEESSGRGRRWRAWPMIR